MNSTLGTRLSLSLLMIIVVLAAFVSVTLFLTLRFHQAEVQQKVNRDVARHIADERTLFLDDGTVDTQSLKQLFHELMEVNPSIEVYLLDNDGDVLAYSAPAGRVVTKRVPIAPIRRFLEPQATLPILGADPRNPDARQPFSAAVVQGSAGRRGYLYIVVGGEPYRSAADMLRSSYALRFGATVLGAGLVVALLVGVLFFRWQTRRLSALGQAVDRFRSGGFKAAIPIGSPPRGNDDLDRLERSFGEMMRTMVDQLGQIERTEIERREFIASISHDLRTPLASLRGYLETLQLKSESVSPAERDRHLAIALRQANRLSTLVEELFEFSKLDVGHMEMHPEAFSLAELVHDVVQKLESAAREKGVRLEAEIPDSRTTVSADIGLIERVLTNVIDNAIKYSRSGGLVHIGVQAADGRVQCSVRDDGPGIAPEELPRVFEPFYRSPSARETNSEGSGLGLAIAQSILRLHATHIHAQCQPGGGTEFRFALPAFG